MKQIEFYSWCRLLNKLQCVRHDFRHNRMNYYNNRPETLEEQFQEYFEKFGDIIKELGEYTPQQPISENTTNPELVYPEIQGTITRRGD